MFLFLFDVVFYLFFRFVTMSITMSQPKIAVKTKIYSHNKKTLNILLYTESIKIWNF